MYYPARSYSAAKPGPGQLNKMDRLTLLAGHVGGGSGAPLANMKLETPISRIMAGRVSAPSHR